jgi:hypothetical protein
MDGRLSLSRIAIPSSVETLFCAFRDCFSLSEVIFESGIHLREFEGLGIHGSFPKLGFLPPLRLSVAMPLLIARL